MRIHKARHEWKCEEYAIGEGWGGGENDWAHCCSKSVGKEWFIPLGAPQALIEKAGLQGHPWKEDARI